ncbi:TRAP transporter small permease [Devosia sp. XK-2]|uniref:TRAP transporter small permease n=1 Tax=Devosia sp. XK-2 TaxID=3126689 RepID=UPI0030CFDB63
MQAFAKRAALLLARATETVATLLLITVTILNLTQVVGRYAFSIGFSWTEELMRYLMIWLMMLGSVAAIYRVEHMGVETLEAMVAPRYSALVRSALYSVGAIFCLVVLIYGWPLALRNAGQVAPASGIPMIYPYMALPVGAVLLLIQIGLSWFGGWDEQRKSPVADGDDV